MNKTLNYKGYIITVKFNKADKNYPFVATAFNGTEKINKNGYDEKQAIDLIKCIIDFTINTKNLKE